MNTLHRFVLVVSLGIPLGAQVDNPPATRSTVSLTIHTTDNYPLDTCVVSGKPLPKDAVEAEAAGREFKLCCKDCQPKLAADPKPFAARLDAAVVATQADNYPSGPLDRALTRCPACRKAFPATGPVDAVTGNMLVRVCSDACARQVDKMRTRIAVNIRAAVARQAAAYACKTCPACGKAPAAQASWIQHGTTLVKVCGPACVEAFKLTPNACVAKVAGKAVAPGADGKAAEPAKQEKLVAPPVKK